MVYPMLCHDVSQPFTRKFALIVETVDCSNSCKIQKISDAADAADGPLPEIILASVGEIQVSARTEIRIVRLQYPYSLRLSLSKCFSEYVL